MSLFDLACKYAQQEWGDGWHRIGVEQRRDTIAKHVLRLLATQDDEHVSDAKVRALLRDNQQLVEEIT